MEDYKDADEALFRHYDEVLSEEPIDSFLGQIISADNISSGCQMYLEFQNKNWKVISWTAQGDYGFDKEVKKVKEFVALGVSLLLVPIIVTMGAFLILGMIAE